MNITIATPAENVCRDFARRYPTANVLRGVRYAAAGRIAWTDLERVFAQALSDGLAAVTA